MIKLEDVREGDVLQWKTINGIRKGCVKRNHKGILVIYVDDIHVFRITDIISAHSAIKL